jgi:hypothetical protein
MRVFVSFCASRAWSLSPFGTDRRGGLLFGLDQMFAGAANGASKRAGPFARRKPHGLIVRRRRWDSTSMDRGDDYRHTGHSAMIDAKPSATDGKASAGCTRQGGGHRRQGQQHRATRNSRYRVSLNRVVIRRTTGSDDQDPHPNIPRAARDLARLEWSAEQLRTRPAGISGCRRDYLSMSRTGSRKTLWGWRLLIASRFRFRFQKFFD